MGRVGSPVGLKLGEDRVVEPPRCCANELEGDAGSAAARARNTACVPRERSAAFGFARSARAYSTCWMLFCLMLTSKVSSGLLKCAMASVEPCTYNRSLYLPVMKCRRCSLVTLGPGFRKASSLASQTMLLTRFPINKSSSMMSGVKAEVSRVKERTLEM